MRGNPNPSPENRFKKGGIGNPVGKSSSQRLLELENAERATRIRSRMLQAIEEATESGVPLNLIEAAVLKLLKDSEDRGLGTPKQTIAGPGPDGEHLVTMIRIVAEDGDSNGQDTT